MSENNKDKNVSSTAWEETLAAARRLSENGSSETDETTAFPDTDINADDIADVDSAENVDNAENVDDTDNDADAIGDVSDTGDSDDAQTGDAQPDEEEPQSTISSDETTSNDEETSSSNLNEDSLHEDVQDNTSNITDISEPSNISDVSNVDDTPNINIGVTDDNYDTADVADIADITDGEHDPHVNMEDTAPDDTYADPDIPETNATNTATDVPETGNTFDTAEVTELDDSSEPADVPESNDAFVTDDVPDDASATDDVPEGNDISETDDATESDDTSEIDDIGVADDSNITTIEYDHDLDSSTSGIDVFVHPEIFQEEDESKNKTTDDEVTSVDELQAEVDVYNETSRYTNLNNEKKSRKSFKIACGIIIASIIIIVASIGAVIALFNMDHFVDSAAVSIEDSSFGITDDDLSMLEAEGYDGEELTETVAVFLEKFFTFDKGSIEDGSWEKSFMPYVAKNQIVDIKENLIYTRTQSEWAEVFSTHPYYQSKWVSNNSITWNILPTTTVNVPYCDVYVTIDCSPLETYLLNSPDLEINRYINCYRIVFDDDYKITSIKKLRSVQKVGSVDEDAMLNDKTHAEKALAAERRKAEQLLKDKKAKEEADKARKEKEEEEKKKEEEEKAKEEAANKEKEEANANKNENTNSNSNSATNTNKNENTNSSSNENSNLSGGNTNTGGNTGSEPTPPTPTPSESSVEPASLSVN